MRVKFQVRVKLKGGLNLRGYGNDIRNFYLLGFMIITGIPNKKLENIKLPPISKARWYTFAIRLLRLYVQTLNPSIELTKCVRFILKFYLNLTLTVKMSPLIQGNNINDYIAYLQRINTKQLTNVSLRHELLFIQKMIHVIVIGSIEMKNI